jgi:signal peptidase II
MAGRRSYLWIVLAVVGVDQLTKWLVDRLLVLHDSRIVVQGLLRLTYVRNEGAAFGIGNDWGLPHQALIFTGASLLALLAIAAYAWRLPPEQRLARAGLGLILGGAVGNLIDRARLGYVIDFIDAHWGTYHWPAFNAADSAITIGVALLVLDMLRQPQPSPAEAPATSAPSVD